MSFQKWLSNETYIWDYLDIVKDKTNTDIKNVYSQEIWATTDIAMDDGVRMVLTEFVFTMIDLHHNN